MHCSVGGVEGGGKGEGNQLISGLLFSNDVTLSPHSYTIQWMYSCIAYGVGWWDHPDEGSND